MMELPWYHAIEPQYGFMLEFDTRGNAEPFLGPTHSMNVPAILRDIGFENVREGPNPYHDETYFGGVGLMRDGRFHDWQRWVTQADKPL